MNPQFNRCTAATWRACGDEKGGGRGGSRAVAVAALTAVYCVSADIGLSFDAVGGVATPVWPPTGIALAALVCAGRSLWPGVYVGAFIANLHTGVALYSVALIAAGNTLEAILGARLLGAVGFRPALDRIRDVVALAVVAAIASTVVSATVGMLSMELSGVDADLTTAWVVWWAGDAMGALIFAPPIMVWWLRGRLRGLQWTEFAAASVALVAMTAFAFGVSVELQFSHLLYTVFPPLLWSAVRFGPRGAATAALLLSLSALAATGAGYGPFSRDELRLPWLWLQFYVGLVGLTGLFVAAVMAERRAAISVRDEFISVAAHELRTPIAALMLRLQGAGRATRELPAQVAARLTPKLDSSEQQVRRLDRLINRVLDVARLSEGPLQLERADVDLARITSDCIDTYLPELAAAGCQLRCNLVAPVVGRWDALRLEQVIGNLLINACSYGRGEPVDVSLTLEHQVAVLRITSRGAVIAPEHRDRIFDRFGRGTPRQRGGLGLGLYIARSFVEGHGGSIAVESSDESGTTFAVILPLGCTAIDERS